MPPNSENLSQLHTQHQKLTNEFQRLRKLTEAIQTIHRTHEQDMARLLRDMAALLTHTADEVECEGAVGDMMQLPRQCRLWEDVRSVVRDQMYQHSQDLQRLPYVEEEDEQQSG